MYHTTAALGKREQCADFLFTNKMLFQDKTKKEKHEEKPVKKRRKICEMREKKIVHTNTVS